MSDPAVQERARTILRDAEVRREQSHIDPWWGIWHRPTGERLSGPPKPFFHPMLQYTMPLYARRWRSRKEAEAALSELRRLCGVGEESAEQASLFDG